MLKEEGLVVVGPRRIVDVVDAAIAARKHENHLIAKGPVE